MSARDEGRTLDHELLETLSLVRLVRTQLDTMCENVDAIESEDVSTLSLAVDVIEARLAREHERLDRFLVTNFVAGETADQTNVIDFFEALKQSLLKDAAPEGAE